MTTSVACISNYNFNFVLVFYNLCALVRARVVQASVVSYWHVPYESEPTEDCLIADLKVGLLGPVMRTWQSWKLPRYYLSESVPCRT